VTTTISIVPDGPFSLTAAANFGFGPNSGRPMSRDAEMKLAFPTDDFEHHAYVSLNQEADGTVTGRVDSDAPADVVERQVRRILSLDGSGTEWMKVGESDPVLGRMQHDHPGLRPVLFHSPYEAAAWSIISARKQRAQGAIVRTRISQQVGRTYGEGSEQAFAFPTPAKLLELREVQSLELMKVQRLHAVARAALNGDLDSDFLLSMSTEDALEHLQRLPGIGPLYGTLILLRSTGTVDSMTGTEPRLPLYLAHFYGLGTEPATPAQIADIMDGWRPFRTWSSVLTRASGDALGLPLPPRPDSARRLRR
jgi:DNA-3-methyladenine glycosylase II